METDRPVPKSSDHSEPPDTWDCVLDMSSVRVASGILALAMSWLVPDYIVWLLRASSWLERILDAVIVVSSILCIYALVMVAFRGRVWYSNEKGNEKEQKK